MASTGPQLFTWLFLFLPGWKEDVAMVSQPCFCKGEGSILGHGVQQQEPGLLDDLVEQGSSSPWTPTTLNFCEREKWAIWLFRAVLFWSFWKWLNSYPKRYTHFPGKCLLCPPLLLMATPLPVCGLLLAAPYVGKIRLLLHQLHYEKLLCAHLAFLVLFCCHHTTLWVWELLWDS